MVSCFVLTAEELNSEGMGLWTAEYWDMIATVLVGC